MCIYIVENRKREGLRSFETLREYNVYSRGERDALMLEEEVRREREKEGESLVLPRG